MYIGTSTLYNIASSSLELQLDSIVVSRAHLLELACSRSRLKYGRRVLLQLKCELLLVLLSSFLLHNWLLYLSCKNTIYMCQSYDFDDLTWTSFRGFLGLPLFFTVLLVVTFSFSRLFTWLTKLTVRFSLLSPSSFVYSFSADTSA